MNYTNILAAIKKARAALDEAFAVMEQEFSRSAQENGQHVGKAQTKVQQPGRDAAEVRQRTSAPPAAAGKKPLPAAPTAARRAQPLTEAARREHLPAAVAQAKRIVQALGPDYPQLGQGLRGQLALERIPFDDELITLALAEARGQ